MIQVTQEGRILAALSPDGTWCVHGTPEAGSTVHWLMRNGWNLRVQVEGLFGSDMPVLVVRRANGLLAGLAWRTGSYIANWLRGPVPGELLICAEFREFSLCC